VITGLERLSLARNIGVPRGDAIREDLVRAEIGMLSLQP
jgi:hypothetical protein